ncbi:hypothetical protein IL306_012025 [Fusarium sp. DS 682]|nr:hypothetical protein IL306_012025 [Fusarium sp. DS 682]
MDGHMIYVLRHAHANSNIGISQHGIDISNMNDEAFSKLLQSKKVLFKDDDFLPDNLTQHGKGELQRYVDEHPEFLDSLDLILCSPLTRSILTAKGLARKNKTRVECLFGLTENTNWVQDIPPITYVKDNQRYASTFSILGGPDEGVLVGEEIVNLTVDTPEDQWESWNDPQKRSHMIETYPTLREIEEQDTRLRVQIRDLVQTIAKSKGSREVKVLIVTHGGKINTITGNYNTSLKKSKNGQWKLDSSSCFANLGTAVYKFGSATDEKAKLVEAPESEYYTKLLGSHYQRPKDDPYRDGNGNAVDERDLYEEFLKGARKDAQEKLEPNLRSRLLNWKGIA